MEKSFTERAVEFNKRLNELSQELGCFLSIQIGDAVKKEEVDEKDNKK